MAFVDKTMPVHRPPLNYPDRKNLLQLYTILIRTKNRNGILTLKSYYELGRVLPRS